MRAIDSVIIRLPEGSEWPMFEAALAAAHGFRQKPAARIRSGGIDFVVRWTAIGTAIVEIAKAEPPPQRSVVADFDHLLGKVPDAEVAALAGCSRWAVKDYRDRRGIVGFRP